MGAPQHTRDMIVIIHSPTASAAGAGCDNTYATIEYGSGQVYGPSSCISAAELYVDIDTPARDLIQIQTSVEFVVNTGYLNVGNYTIIDTVTNEQVGVREVLTPMDDVVSSRIMLVVDKHVAGRTYSIALQGLTIRNGIILGTTTGSFFARDSKANSMLSAVPAHFNKDPKTSTFRHILQAIAVSDDKIGSL